MHVRPGDPDIFEHSCFLPRGFNEQVRHSQQQQSSYFTSIFNCIAMSESEERSTRKRVRDEDSVEPGPAVPDVTAGDADDSDDEIGLYPRKAGLTAGPMPVPDAETEADGAASNGRKKKRVALPHERLYLEHIPEADRYYKSFMHRDDVNFVTVTKWVSPMYTS